MPSQLKSDRARVVGWRPESVAALEKAISDFGPKSAISELSGISRQAINDILNGNVTPTRKTIERLCEFLNVSFDDILAGQPALPRKALRLADAGLMHINEVNLAYGMGGAFIDELSATEVVRTLPTEWVRQFTRAPAEQLFICRGIGDSMTPTLHDSDMLLVDASQKRISQSDRVWVLTIGDVGMVKRVRAKADGNYTILSDNEHVPDDEAVDGQMFVVGRVVAVIRKM